MRHFLTYSCLILLFLLPGLGLAQEDAQRAITFEDSTIPAAIKLDRPGRWQVSNNALSNLDHNVNDTFKISVTPGDKLNISADVTMHSISPKGGFWGLAMIMKDGTRVQVFNQGQQLRYYVRKPGDKLKPMTFAKLPDDVKDRVTFHVAIDGKQLTAQANDGKAYSLDLPSASIAVLAFQAFQAHVDIHSITLGGDIKLNNTKVNDDEHLKSQLDVADPSIKRPDDPNALVIFYIGDSITRHGFSQGTIKRLGWDHLAGMAATHESRDFAHLFADHVQKKHPNKKVSLHFHSKGGAGAAATRYATLKPYEVLKPEIVVVQLGEHEKQHNGVQSLQTNYRALLSTMQQWDSKPTILCVGVWNPSGKGKKQAYTGWTLTTDQTMKAVCKDLNIPYASMEKHALNPANSGWGTSHGVQWHPNDAGMQAYANELIRMYEAVK
ncbi:MAG: SGNH/GDSL hydrolase family protein [Phycisphaeraceae bacterium JB051]